nr:RHS repeat-associated core domain-containing protein [Granulicella sp. dw_53]
MGRLTNVTEPTGASTGYVYDALNNLRTVNQNGVSGEVPRTRGFIYDSLSRLNSATNPETGNVGYIYDANGNVISKTDARGIAINYGYDVLNRLIAKTSSDGSIHYEYFYDGDTLIDPNAKGHLVHASNDINGANDFYYDPMGRVIRQTFCIPSDCSYSQQISTTYDLAGHVTSLTYPDRRGITQGYDLAGRLQSVSMTAVPISGAASSSPFITSISYFANGSPQSIIYGNGITEQLAQNSRLQTCESNAFLSPSLGGQIIMNHQYFFSSTTGSPCSDTPGNNGNIWGIVDATNVGQGSGQRSQGFTYDSLNRVRTWNTNLMAGGPRSQTFNYDSFGNLTQTSGINMPNYDPIAPFINNRLPASSFGCSPSSNAYAIDPANLGYDLAGNVLCSGAQGYNAQAYIYDAENQITQTQKQIMNNTYNAAASYTYNALGDRIRKDQGGYGSQQYTEYIWSNGRVLAEKNQNGIWTDYIYANGKKIVSAKTSIVRSHLSGTNSTGGDAYRLDTGVLPIPANYTVKAGDVLGFRMWVRNANAGLSMGFTDTTDTSTLCVPDNHGDCFNQESTSDQWVNRVINLGAFVANRTIGVLRMSNYQGPAGRFDIMVMDMAITSSDGTVTQIIGGEPTGSCPTVGSGVPTPDLTCVSEEVTDPSDFAGQPSKTMYFLSDLLGTSQLELSKGGWPVWKGEFSPFGQELDNQITPDRYRFTGKERDAESGLDYFGARYYTSSMGRWMSPDWADKPEAVPYSKLDNPQSLNLYGYVLNNPLSQKDDDGHEIIYSDNLKNSQLVRDTVTATLANPNTSSYLSGYVGKDAPNLMIQSGDLGPPTVTILPNGQTLTTTVQGNTAPDIQTTQMNNDPPQTTLTGATITIDNNTSKGDTPGVMIHESVHAGEAQQNPAQFGKDAKAERGQPHDSRPQEQRANAVRHANEKDINKAVKQIEKYRKKELQ